ncbi:MAG: TIGR03016 family PEP-CTERM system-associated outer membrane protein [Proteobacteria bacterium]|nr:TIGR03016 family PEP-CTERM system-associated outer membrane protein [Pseudomonadota bacterium]
MGFAHLPRLRRTERVSAAMRLLIATSAFLPCVAMAQPVDNTALQAPGTAIPPPPDGLGLSTLVPPLGLSPPQEQSQALPQSSKATTDAGRHGFWLEPRLTVRHTVTSNVRLDPTNTSDQITELIPGFRLLSNTARIRGFADYSLRSAHYWKNTTSDKFWHDLRANAVVEAVDNWLFVDLYGVVSLQPVSVFGSPGDFTPANSNLAQTSTFAISPYVKGRIGSEMDYEARYSVRDTRTDANNRAAVTVYDGLLHVGNRSPGQIVWWAVDATQQTADFSPGRRIDTTALRGRLSYAVTPHLRMIGIGGVESTNQLSPNQQSHSITGFGGDWQPSERTRLFFERENRYFGESHNVDFEHRTSRTVWRYIDRRRIVNGLGAQSPSLGSLYDLLNGFYSRVESDPIQRAQLVQAEIDRRGLPANMQVFQDFLTSQSILQRVQQLSFAILGQRSSVTMVVSRINSRQLGGLLNLGDDFGTNTQIRQQGWNLILAHRLTVNSSVSASLGDMRSVGSVPGVATRTRTYILGWNTFVTGRTNVGIQVRRVLSDGSINQYDESDIMGFITHRF